MDLLSIFLGGLLFIFVPIAICIIPAIIELSLYDYYIASLPKKKRAKMKPIIFPMQNLSWKTTLIIVIVAIINGGIISLFVSPIAANQCRELNLPYTCQADFF